jgi:hypothetical protein
MLFSSTFQYFGSGRHDKYSYVHYTSTGTFHPFDENNRLNSVADPGCYPGSQMRIFSIPDPGPRIQICIKVF